MDTLPSDIFINISQYHGDLQTLNHLTRTCRSLAHTLNKNEIIWRSLSRSLLNQLLLASSSQKHQLKFHGKLSSLAEVEEDVQALKKFMRRIMLNLKLDQVGKLLSLTCHEEPFSTDKYDRVLTLFKPFENFDNCDAEVTRLFQNVPHLLLCDYAKDDQMIPEQYVIETLDKLFGQYNLLPYGESYDCLEDAILTKHIEIVRTVLRHIPQSIRKEDVNYLKVCVAATVPYEMLSFLLEEFPERAYTDIESVAMHLCMAYPDHGFDILHNYQIDFSKIAPIQISRFIRNIPLSDRKKQVLEYFIDNGLILSELPEERLVTWVIHDEYQMNNDEDILLLLLNHGAQVFNPMGYLDPLSYAVLYSNNRHCVLMIPQLIRFGADVNSDSLLSRHTGGRQNNYPGSFLEILHLLLEGGADASEFSETYEQWRNPLFSLVNNAYLGDDDRVAAGRVLIDYGADIHAVSPIGQTLLQFAEAVDFPSDVAQEFYSRMVEYTKNKHNTKA